MGIYLYILIFIVILIIILWIWESGKRYFGPKLVHFTNEKLSEKQSYFQDWFRLESHNHHLYRLYAIERFSELDSMDSTKSMIQENSKLMIKCMEKILVKDHFIHVQDIYEEKYRLYISCIQDEESYNKKKKEFRRLNRLISEKHEDWWGIHFDVTSYTKQLNELDMCYLLQLSCLKREEWDSSKKYFHSLLDQHEAIEQICLNCFK